MELTPQQIYDSLVANPEKAFSVIFDTAHEANRLIYKLNHVRQRQNATLEAIGFGRVSRVLRYRKQILDDLTVKLTVSMEQRSPVTTYNIIIEESNDGTSIQKA